MKKYFAREDSQYRINRDLRERVVFAVHDLIEDAPFSHMDLILARNVLIYFDAETQKKVLPLLHYGLNEGGILFMGTAETIGEAHEDLFETVDRKWRVYRAFADKHGILPVPVFEEYTHRWCHRKQENRKGLPPWTRKKHSLKPCLRRCWWTGT